MKLLLFLLLANCMVRTAIGDEDIKLVNNGYQNVVIRIAEDVTQNDQLINKIKEAFTEGSAFLYKATRNRAYLANITIVVPWAWNKHELTEEKQRVKESILVQTSPSASAAPFVTRINSICGEPGGIMKLSSQFFFNETLRKNLGGFGKAIVHEWGHLRFGVYDEYPLESARTSHYYDGTSYVGIRCSAKIEGVSRGNCIVINDSYVHRDCHFMDTKLDEETGYGSLMYKQWLPQITEFCDGPSAVEKARHNNSPDNNQNKMCDRRSVWEVMRKHIDFRNGKNPKQTNLNTKPFFNIVQYKSKQKPSVLVVDVSGSMETKMESVRQAMRTYLNEYQDGGRLAIVLFNGTYHVFLNLTTVNTETRPKITKTFPTLAKGATSIASGILAAMEILVNHNEPDGEITVVTDGFENTHPKIPSIWKQVRFTNWKGKFNSI